jgi:hypothetical protein
MEARFAVTGRSDKASLKADPIERCFKASKK